MNSYVLFNLLFLATCRKLKRKYIKSYGYVIRQIMEYIPNECGSYMKKDYSITISCRLFSLWDCHLIPIYYKSVEAKFDNFVKVSLPYGEWDKKDSHDRWCKRQFDKDGNLKCFILYCENHKETTELECTLVYFDANFINNDINKIDFLLNKKKIYERIRKFKNKKRSRKKRKLIK